MSNTINEIKLIDLNIVTGGSLYAIDECVWGVPEFILDCKTARANNLNNGTPLEDTQTIDRLRARYRSHGLVRRLGQSSFDDIVERYYFENALFM